MQKSYNYCHEMKNICIFEIEMRHFLVVFKLISKMFTRLCRGLFSLYFHNKITQFSLKIRSFFNKRKEEQIFVLSYNQCIFEGYSVFKKTIT